jgi:aryl-alcohol dehydrogenase-like predicted oxidoreductase
MANKIALGTAQFGIPYGVANRVGKIAENDVKSILSTAIHEGIDTLDTAAAYGDSESVLGRANVDSWKIVTKIPTIPESVNFSKTWVEDEFKNSLKKLRVNFVYGLLLHSPDQLFSRHGEDLLSSLIKFKQDGLVSKIGVSIYSPQELPRLFDLYNFDIVQVPFNPIDQRLLNSGWAKKLRELAVEIHIRSIFLQGLLLMPADKRPSKFSIFNNTWAQWDDWLRLNNMSALEACMRFVSSSEYVDKVIVGIDSLKQFKEIIGVSSDPLIEGPQFGQIDGRLLNPSQWSAL